MNKLRTKEKFYSAYNDGFKEKAKKMIKSNPQCYNCGFDFKGVLTVAHLDQNTKNDDNSNIRILCQSCHIKFDQPFHIFSMQTKTTKTDNSHFEIKVQMRIDSLPNKEEINVLEAFAGDSRIWNEVKKRTDKKINILKIEMKDNKKGVYLKGDNMKFIPLFDFDKFDVLDFDAYGSPYNQLNVVFLKNFRGPVHCTFIQSGMGSLNKKMLVELGYSEAMQKKIKSIFNRNGMQKMQDYLYLHGVKWIKGYFYDRKNYFWFCLDK